MTWLVFWSVILHPFSFGCYLMQGFHEKSNPYKALVWMNKPSARLHFAIYLLVLRKSGHKERALMHAVKRKIKMAELGRRVDWESIEEGEG